MAQKSLLLFFTIYTVSPLMAQVNRRHPHFRDSLDGAFDFSNFLMEIHGFVPVPAIITEPALGGFGGALALMFIHKEKPLIDTLQSGTKVIPVPPDITAVAAAYTVNDTWLIGIRRSGTWRKIRAKYRIAAAYANVNLSFYRTPVGEQEEEFQFNFKTVPFSGVFMKQFKGSLWSAGLQYLYLKTKLKPVGSSLPDFVEDKEIKSLASMPGVIAEYDNRDNIFTPDKGLRFHLSLGWSDDAFGSDFDYANLNVFLYGYHPFSKKVIGGLRYEMQQVFDDPPFYLLPYVDLRGIPIARYQGNIFSVLEGEIRWDFVPRWSLVAFGGTGKAYDAWGDFDDTDFVSSGGAGFRYLIARKFKIRTGIDIARGPEQWAYYIVMGSAWLK